MSAPAGPAGQEIGRIASRQPQPPFSDPHRDKTPKPAPACTACRHPLTRLWIRAALAERAAAVTAGLSDIEYAERAGELLSLTLRADTRGEAVLVTRRRDVI